MGNATGAILVRISHIAAAGVLAAVLAATGCSKAAPAAPVAPTTIDSTVEAWRQAGLETSPFATASDAKLAGGACQRGVVEGLDTMLCEYTDGDAARRATDAGRRQVGATTGVALASGHLLLVAADRSESDPSGRTMNRVARVFRGAE